MGRVWIYFVVLVVLLVIALLIWRKVTRPSYIEVEALTWTTRMWDAPHLRSYLIAVELDGIRYEVIPDTGSSILIVDNPNPPPALDSIHKIKYLGGQVTRYVPTEGILKGCSFPVPYGHILYHSDSIAPQNVMGLQLKRHKKGRLRPFLDAFFERSLYHQVQFDYPGGTFSIGKVPERAARWTIPFFINDHGCIISQLDQEPGYCLWDTGCSHTMYENPDSVRGQSVVTIRFRTHDAPVEVPFTNQADWVDPLPDRQKLFGVPLIIIGNRWLQTYCITFDFIKQVVTIT